MCSGLSVGSDVFPLQGVNPSALNVHAGFVHVKGRQVKRQGGVRGKVPTVKFQGPKSSNFRNANFKVLRVGRTIRPGGIEG